MVEELQKSRRELLKSQFDMRMGTSKEVHAVKNMRRYIARLETIKKEQTKASANVAPTPKQSEGAYKKTSTKKPSAKKATVKKSTKKSSN